MKVFSTKLISMFLAAVMLAGLFPVNAGAIPEVEPQPLSISYQDVKGLIGLVETTLASQSKNDRIQLFNAGKVYFETDDGMQSLAQYRLQH